MSSARVKEIADSVYKYVGFMRAANKAVIKVTVTDADHEAILKCLEKGESITGFRNDGKKLFFYDTPLVRLGENND